MKDMVAGAVASMVGMLITEEAINKFKNNAYTYLKEKAEKSENKYDDKVLELLSEEAAKQMVQMFMVDIVTKADDLAKSTDTSFDDSLVDVLQKVTKVTDKMIEENRKANASA